MVAARTPSVMPTAAPAMSTKTITAMQPDRMPLFLGLVPSMVAE